MQALCGYLLLEPVSRDCWSPGYAGVGRRPPAQVVSDIDQPPASNVWWQEMQCAGTADPRLEGAIARLPDARKIQHAYLELGYTFDIVAFYLCDDEQSARHAATTDGFLGYDVIDDSLWSALQDHIELPVAQPWTDILSLCELQRRFMVEHVNKHGLLSSYDDAVLIAATSRTLMSIDTTVELPQNAFVVGVTAVTPDVDASTSA